MKEEHSKGRKESMEGECPFQCPTVLDYVPEGLDVAWDIVKKQQLKLVMADFVAFRQSKACFQALS